MKAGRGHAAGIGGPGGRPPGTPAGGTRQPRGAGAARSTDRLLARDTHWALQLPAGACHPLATRAPEGLWVGWERGKKAQGQGIEGKREGEEKVGKVREMEREADGGLTEEREGNTEGQNLGKLAPLISRGLAQPLPAPTASLTLQVRPSFPKRPQLQIPKTHTQPPGNLNIPQKSSSTSFP